MNTCQFTSDCSFVSQEMAKRPVLAGMYKRQFCNGDSDKCARVLVRNALGKAAVPTKLYPNQQDQAREIIAQSRKESAAGIRAAA